MTKMSRTSIYTLSVSLNILEGKVNIAFGGRYEQFYTFYTEKHFCSGTLDMKKENEEVDFFWS